MTHFDYHKRSRVVDRMGLSHLITPTIFMSSNRRMAVVIRLKGMPAMTLNDSKLAELQLIWHRALINLDSRFSVQVTQHRRPVGASLGGEFREDFPRQVNSAYLDQAKYLAYHHDLYLAVTYCGAGARVGKAFRNKSGGQHILDEGELVEFEGAINGLLSMLRPFRPVLLRSDGVEMNESLINYLGLIVNGGYSELVGNYDLSPYHGLGGSCDDVSLLSYVCVARQLHFGRHIQFQGIANSDSKYGAVLSIKQYPAATDLDMLSLLGEIKGEWISVDGFSLLNKDVGIKRIKQQLSKLSSVGDVAVSQQKSLGDLLDRVGGEELCLGLHSHSILMIADTAELLAQNLISAASCYTEKGCVCVRESVGLEPSFWSMMVGNMEFAPRRSLINSINMTHISPLHNFPQGHNGRNHLRSAVCLLETPAKTPFYFNYHTRGSAINPSLGHTLIVGASNSGKTVLLTFLDSQRSKYGGYRFFFDRDCGAALYFRALDAPYIEISPSGLNKTHFNPFSIEGSAESRRFLTSWLEQLALPDGLGHVGAKELRQIRQCVDYAYDCLGADERCLSNVVRVLPFDFPYKDNLLLWLHGNGGEEDGEFAGYFDNVCDTLSLESMMGFDMTYLLDQAPAKLRQCVLMYLFYRIEQVCCGELVSIVLDEGWQYFADSYWRDKMHAWLPTLRKKNAHIVIATQSPSTILKSPIRDMVLDNCATQIYFPNASADDRVYCEALSLTDREYELVKTLSVSARWMLVKQGEESCVCRLNLHAAERYLPILSTNAASLELCSQIIKQLGSSPSEWIEPLLLALKRGVK